ncbi:hypothetical protein Hanom_Chr00s154362g01823071 [Helianthus anomalus]
MCCPLCYFDRDSRDHLFFKCAFAVQVWNEMKKLASLDNVDDSWSSVVSWVEQHAKSKNVDHIVFKLLIAASSYYIWQERNNRIFKSMKRTVNQVVEVIKSTVRLRLMGFKFRTPSTKERIRRTWKIEDTDMDPG